MRHFLLILLVSFPSALVAGAVSFADDTGGPDSVSQRLRKSTRARRSPGKVKSASGSRAANGVTPDRSLSSYDSSGEAALLASSQRERPRALERRFFASLIYSSASQVNYRGNVSLFGTPTDYTATESTNPAFGLTGGYLYRRADGFGFSGELSFEFVRGSNGIVGNAGNLNIQGTWAGNGGTNVWATDLDVNYTFGSDFYLFAGPNFPLTFLNKGGQSLQGLPGYQAGAGYGFADRWSVEASYRMLRMKGTINGAGSSLQVDEATLPGFIGGVKLLF